MYINAVLWLVFTLIFSCGLRSAQSPNFTFSPADLNKQLSQNTVRQIYQDSTGYFWVVTQEGLSRYDGYQLLSFISDPRKPDSLSSDNVRAVLEDHKKRFWVATDGGGLNLFNSANQTFSVWQEGDNSSAKPTSNRQVSLYLDSQNFIWLGYRDGNFSRFNPDNMVFEHFNTRELLPGLDKDAAVTSITEDANAIWLATDGNGLLKLDKTSQQLTRFYTGSSTALFSDRLTQVFIDAQQRLWLTSHDAGISVGDPQGGNITTWQHHENQGDSVAANLVHTIYQDQQQRIWLGTEAGASLWNGRDKFTTYNKDSGLSHSKVLSILQDPSGLLWFGTYSGVTKSIEVAFEHIDSGLASNVIQGFAETQSSAGESAIWVASYGGLTQLNSHGDVLRVLNKDSQPALRDARVMTVSGDHNMLWFGTRGGGLGRLNVDNQQIKYYVHDPDDPTSLSFNGVPSVFPDTFGNIWVGTFGGGLNYLPAGSDEFVHYRFDENNPRSLNSDRVLAVHQLLDGTIVVGTVSGINLLDPVNLDFDHIEHQPDNVDSLSASMAWSFYQDPKGQLWVGTQGGGVNKWQAEDIAALNNHFTHYDSFNGLPSSHIYAILDDDKGHLWLSSTAGLTRLNPKTAVVRNFDTSEGLNDSEFNFGAGFKDSQGIMYFGGNSGFVRFHPDEIKDNQFIPPVVLVRIKKLNEQVWFDVPYQTLQGLVLDHTDYFISFEFAALDFNSPEQNEYRYKLEGLDPNWIELGHSRLATFTNLPAGDYVLKVQASNNQGLWNTQGINLPIHMLPPPWKTLWAYSVYLIIVLLIVLNFIWQYRRKRLRAIERLIELEDKVEARTAELLHANQQLGLSMNETQKARELAELASKEKSDFLAIMSHEIRTPMNGVLGMTEVLLSSDLKPKQQHFAQQVYRSGRLLLDLLNNLLDFSKLEAGKATLESVPVDLEALLEEVCDLFSEAANTKGLYLNAVLSGEPLPQVYGDPARLRQIIANLTTNAIKFTERGEVNVIVKRLPYRAPQSGKDASGYQYGRFEICVQDTGIGMEVDRQHKVFEMFTQADASTTRKYGGTGLGLAICKQLSSLMGGTLEVHSKIGEGSCFCLVIDLPLIEHTVEEPVAISECPTVHLVNLSPGLGLSIATMLKKLHIKTVHVQRIKSELATAKTGLWISLPESESLLQEAGISPSNWICLLPTSQWQDHEYRNVLPLPVHFSGLQKSLNVALGIDHEEQNCLNEHYRNYQKFQANILVAEDSMTNQEVAKSMLGLLGCEVWLADNGAEAVEQVNLQKPDLVLMDCQMPVMDGYAATKAIRKNWPNIPIVALTAGMGDNLNQQCLDAGMNEVMSKPFSLQELEQTLLRFLPESRLPYSLGQVTEQNASMCTSNEDELDSEDQVLDMETVDTLLKISRETGKPVFCRVLDAFTQEAKKLIARLNEHVSEDDIDVSVIADITHALKSMAGNSGAKALYELCRELEVKLSNNEHHEITVLVQSLDASFSISCAKLDIFRNDSGKYN
ncbi:hybrid sensor histidine kinase/response regulator [Paraglaciecola sp. MB-3u-78]|uniref:hybrid sensor histidine kinase/response regulator n=1 Tax=Paraglaciecola sp. MB-3u-78 TaxID=2058332 RepID=UPI000C34283F|nr:hybrid sensor histidine kinase/response regulator [Paraglaciecola sp. MB-3u-78]PKH00353.1 histidine kinase [Paraglaciecola sp. MB-3u-78]